MRKELLFKIRFELASSTDPLNWLLRGTTAATVSIEGSPCRESRIFARPPPAPPLHMTHHVASTGECVLSGADGFTPREQDLLGFFLPQVHRPQMRRRDHGTGWYDMIAGVVVSHLVGACIPSDKKVDLWYCPAGCCCPTNLFDFPPSLTPNCRPGLQKYHTEASLLQRAARTFSCGEYLTTPT